MGSPEAAPILFPTVLLYQDAVLLGVGAVWRPPVGRTSRPKMNIGTAS